ncbi:MaoC family dehydratase [Dietzia maris]|uniref:MaoC family dehydratase n=1 Tax=Dietzia maris TaxID=37915 RepID=UPI0037CBEBAA
MTLTDGVAAAHQAILGDRMKLPLDATLAKSVSGSGTPLAHPGLVTDIAIGQSTIVTHFVKANLFYRGLRFLSFPHLGDTLTTRTEVVGLRENAPRPGRAPTGLAALHMVTENQHGEPVLDFYRCAMLPLSPHPDSSRPIHDDDLSVIGREDSTNQHLGIPDWNFGAWQSRAQRDDDLVGTTFVSSIDVVSGAPELARLTLNVAAVHHDASSGPGTRLVYGGHTIGLALAQATRALPDIVTVLAWRSCDHTGPVREGDSLSSELHVDNVTPAAGGAQILELRSLVFAHRDGGERDQVLDWRFSVLAI